MSSKLETESRDDSQGALLRPVLLAFCEGLSFALELPAEGSVTIGRDDECDLRIDHRSVSRRHARVHTGKAFAIEDERSRNGTRVRGIRIVPETRVALQSGDVIECGDATLILRELPVGGAETVRQRKDLLVGAEGRWFQAPGAGRVNLGRRGALRRVLVRLVEQQAASPGVGISVDEVVAAGWPNDRMQYESGAARAYVTVQRLRSLGLKEILITRDDGYLLDPDVHVEHRDED
jgi:hypothetical protein